jgi:hypothetical protein
MLKIFQYVVHDVALHCIYINRNYEYKRSHPWAMVCDVCVWALDTGTTHPTIFGKTGFRRIG